MTALNASQLPDAGAGTSVRRKKSWRGRLTAVAGFLLFSAGTALGGAAIGALEEASAYQAAAPCAADARVAGPDCFAREPVTVLSVSISHGKTSDSAVVDLDSPGHSRQVSLSPVDRVESELRAGSSVVAREYRGHITAVEVGNYVIGTGTANPIVQARLLAFVGLCITGLGLVVLASLIPGVRTLWRPTPFPLGPAAGLAADRPLTLPLVLRPEARNARGHVVGIGTIALAGLVVIVRLGDWAPLGFVLLSVFLLGYVTVRWLYLHNADIFVDELHVGKRDLFGRVTALDRSAIQKVVLTMQESTTRYRTTQIRRLFLVGQDGRSWLRLNGTYWSTADVEMLARALRIPVEGSWDEIADLAAVRRAIPGSFTWLEVHSTRAGIVLGLFLVLLVVAAILIATALQGRAP